MTGFKCLHLFLLVVLLAAASFSVGAEIPKIITYQGYLTDNEGAPIDGAVLINFKIYNSEAGDDSLWWSGYQTVQVENGVFTYILGSSNPIPADFFELGTEPFLGVKVGTDPELAPRTPITASPYAWKAQAAYSAEVASVATVAQSISCSNCISTTQIDDGSINTNKIAPNAVTSDKIQNGTIQFADIGTNGAVSGQVMKWNGSQWVADNDLTGAGGDITAVLPGSGLSGGGSTGDVTLSVGTNALTATHIAADAIGASELANNAVGSAEIIDGSITSADIMDATVNSADIANESITSSDILDETISSYDIANLTILNSDISASADIALSKISGTAVNLSSDQTISGYKKFSGAFRLGDSALYANSVGIIMGTNYYGPQSNAVLTVARPWNSTSSRIGIRADIDNYAGEARTIESKCYTDNERYAVYGYASYLTATGQTQGTSYGVYGRGDYGLNAYGGYFEAKYATVHRYGVYGYSGGVSSPSYYGVYGSCGSSVGYYAGYFYGNVECTGVYTKSGGGYVIDHPDDPDNMYLFHSDVSSPEMKNVYDGVVVLDEYGEAVVELPVYFESLNEKFRYQLTPIGASMPNLYVSQKIDGNQFVISGGEPSMEVSWMVTGIRKDAFAKNAEREIETAKAADKQGLYRNPELFGYGIEKSVEYENHQNAGSDEIRK